MDHEPTLLHGPGVPGPIAWLDHHAGKLRQWWRTHHKSILWLAIGAMAAVAAWRMGQSLPRLLWESSSPGAMDIMYRREEMQLWFAGSAVYDVVPRAPYPPANQLPPA